MREAPPIAEQYYCRQSDWVKCPHCESDDILLYIGEEAVGPSGEARAMNWFECQTCKENSWDDTWNKGE